MNTTTPPVWEYHPILHARCLQLAEGDLAVAALLCALVVTTHTNGTEGIALFDGETGEETLMALTPELQDMNLHLLMSAAN